MMLFPKFGGDWKELKKKSIGKSFFEKTNQNVGKSNVGQMISVLHKELIIP